MLSFLDQDNIKANTAKQGRLWNIDQEKIEHVQKKQKCVQWKENLNLQVQCLEETYPPLPTKSPTHPYQANDFIKGITSTISEKKETRLQTDKDRHYANYKYHESYHVASLKAHFGPEWYNYVKNTKFDCDEAIKIRESEEREQEEREERYYWRQRDLEDEWEKEDEDEKEYIKTLSPQEQYAYEMQKEIDLKHIFEAESILFSSLVNHEFMQAIKRNELLIEFENQQLYKVPKFRWDYFKEQEQRQKF
jgi:hypothetical protein